jgi:multicomponent Na+:H+ antiporter subunit F
MSPGSVQSAAIVIAAVFLSVSIFLAFTRLVRGPALPDRVIALDLMTTMTVASMTLYAIATHQQALLDATLVVALVSFLATIAFARYLERRARRD